MDQVSQIRQKTDIVALISEYIVLRQMGRNFKANCPFHGEKTPSFVVSPERQIWHCFGCNKGGDAFTFLMEFERVEFPEALKILAQKAGIELERTQFETGISAKKEKLYQLNKLAMEFYHYVLVTHPVGKKALSYLLETRGLNKKVVDTFGIGYAPRSGDALVSYLTKKKKYENQLLIDAGLAYIRQGKPADFFMHRIMFPLFDHRDNIVGFSGRVFDQNYSAGQAGKYVNTKETLIYHKGDTLFGIQVTKKEIKQENQVILMEGEFDVMSSFQEGIGNALAVKGTALTQNQVNLIARFAEHVVLCFDHDSAGIAAMKRSLPLLEKKGLATTVVLSVGKDPDEAVRENPIEFKKAVKNHQNIYDYLIDTAIATEKIETSEGKKKVTDELLPLLQNIENEIVKEHYLRRLSRELETTYEGIVRQIDKLKQGEQKTQITASVQVKRDREEILEEYLLSLIVQSKLPKQALEDAVAGFSDVLSRERAYQKILHHLLAHFAEINMFDSKTFADSLPTELLSVYDKCFLFPLPKFEDEEVYTEEIAKVVSELRVLYIQKKMQELNDLIKQKEKEGNGQDLEKLQEEFSALTQKLDSRKKQQAL